MLRFYFAFLMAKLAHFTLKLLKRPATYFPGELAIKICPKFLKYIGKPNTIIMITGTNGKTTCTNMIIDCLQLAGKKVLCNREGSNIAAGIATAFVNGVNLLNKSQYEYGAIELDERSSIRVLPYAKPDYLLCTNLFRDSMLRNANPEFIFNQVNNNLPKETKLVLNGDDLISSELGSTNSKKYFSISKQDSDTDKCENIINDMQICPKCQSILKYNYVKYHHIGNAYCPSCGFKSPASNYVVTKIDYDNNKINVEYDNKVHTFNMLTDSMFNIYNQIAVIALLKEINVEDKYISELFNKSNITETRYKKEIVDGYSITTHLAKGQNPIACSCIFDYLKKEKHDKEIIMFLYDVHDAKTGSEIMDWVYDADFEFLNSDNIKKIIIAGPRDLDFYNRLLIAGIPSERLVIAPSVLESSNYLSMNKNNEIFILHDIYTAKLAWQLKDNIVARIREGK